MQKKDSIKWKSIHNKISQHYELEASSFLVLPPRLAPCLALPRSGLQGLPTPKNCIIQSPSATYWVWPMWARNSWVRGQEGQDMPSPPGATPRAPSDRSCHHEATSSRNRLSLDILTAGLEETNSFLSDFSSCLVCLPNTAHTYINLPSLNILPNSTW